MGGGGGGPDPAPPGAASDGTAIEHATDRDGMTLELHKALARAAIGAWGTGDFSRMDEVFAPGYRMRRHHDPDGGTGDLDLEALKAFAAEFRAGFPDFRDTIDLQLAEGDLVATRFTSTGTHAGPFRGMAPTGRKLSWTGMVIDRIRDGRIVESWGNWDMMGMLQQLGAVRLEHGAR
jgi:predicted ester cyclase